MPRELDEYRRKRSAGKTFEPFGGKERRPGMFCVQKHGATRLHYDFRLELGGALKSWAVPRGPSLDPAQKRLAVHVEDHPVEYADFEGIIPKGNYGAGAVIVWDRGLWVPLEDPEQGLEKGKLLFELKGYKLRGVWTLVRTKQKGRSPSRDESKEWLLIKKPDGWARTDTSLSQESILSGCTLEELRDGEGTAKRMLQELRRKKVTRKPLALAGLEVMLAETGEKPFSDPEWLYEIKYDGFRMVVAREAGRAKLLYRRGSDATALYPDIASAAAVLPFENVVLDGELVVLDEESRPSFQRLQKRAELSNPRDIERAAIELPATVYVFDLLAVDDYDLRKLPLRQRKAFLERLLPSAGPLRFSDHIQERGEEMFDQVRKMGLEGIVAKKADGPYRSGRSGDWLKLRVDRTGDFVVVGYSPSKREARLSATGARSGFGALHLAVSEAGGFAYAGRVGTGFSNRQLDEIRRDLDARRRSGPPCTGPVPKDRKHVWAEPELVCEVRYKEWTEGSLLRQPAFLRLRDDKSPQECLREAPLRHRIPKPEPIATSAKTIRFTNQDKVFWPQEGYTKGDLIDFCRKISRWLLPYLQDRPVVLTRYPDGITGKSFFQKDAPEWIPGGVRTERMWSEHASREIDDFICDDEETLLFLINMGSIPLHVWASRVQTLEKPDWCVLDLDPKEAAFKHVVRIAKVIRELCEEIELECFIKTSGSTGLHVLVPLGGSCTYQQCRSLAELLARVIVDRLPEIATITRATSARKGRVYIDFLQNGHGRLLVSPFSVRPLPCAPVSTPIQWSEVNARLDPKKFTIQTVPARLERQGTDPLRGVLELQPDLPRALALLAAKMNG